MKIYGRQNRSFNIQWHSALSSKVKPAGPSSIAKKSSWYIWIKISEISEYRYIYDMAEHLFSDQFCRKTREFGLNTDHPPIWQKKYRPTSYFITAVWIQTDFWSLISSCIEEDMRRDLWNSSLSALWQLLFKRTPLEPTKKVTYGHLKIFYSF